MKSIQTLFIAAILITLPAVSGEPPTRLEIEEMMGLRSEGDLIRGQLDTVGFMSVGYSLAGAEPPQPPVEH